MHDVPRVCAVVAVAKNGVIGRDNDLPWHLRSDLKLFRRLTTDKPVIMGRKTFQSIGNPLPDRDNIVVTRDPDFTAEGITIVTTLAEALDRAQHFARDRGAEEICIIGGATIYRAMMDDIDRLYVTEVDLRPEGDTLFPEIDPGRWREVGREHYDRSERDDAAFDLVTYERRR